MDSQDNPPRKIVPITPVAQTPADAPDSTQEMVSLYVAHNKIYPRSVQGLFAYWRWVLVFITQIVFYGLPWLEWGQRQAVLFDVYRPKQAGAGLEPGHKSLAVRLTLQNDEATLTDAEIDEVVRAILRQTEQDLGARLRA